MMRLIKVIWFPILILLLLENGRGITSASNYLIGLGSYDITGPAADVNMMGYANMEQIASGVHFRLRARTFIVAEPNGNRVVFVNLDACMASQLVTIKVLERLKARYGNLYTEKNVAISGIHTHAGPGGYLQYVVYIVTSLGFVRQSFDVLVDGIEQSIIQAHNSLQPGSIYVNKGELLDAGVNRSPSAHLNNLAAERSKYKYDVDKDMTLLKFVDDEWGPVGSFNWFATHGTSMSRTNSLISGDNKGAAARFMEDWFDQDSGEGIFSDESKASGIPRRISNIIPFVRNNHHELRELAAAFQSSSGKSATRFLSIAKRVRSSLRRADRPRFISAFCQANCGDVSPNVLGAFCIDTGLPCDFNHSTCGGKNELCYGRGPGYPDEFESTRIIGERQFKKAVELFNNASEQLEGKVDYRHTYVDFSKLQVTIPKQGGDTETVKTCPAAMGFAFAAGTTDGPGAFDFKQGDDKGNAFWRLVRDLLKKPKQGQVDCQHPKPILLDTGEMKVPYDWAVSEATYTLRHCIDLIASNSTLNSWDICHTDNSIFHFLFDKMSVHFYMFGSVMLYWIERNVDGCSKFSFSTTCRHYILFLTPPSYQISPDKSTVASSRSSVFLDAISLSISFGNQTSFVALYSLISFVFHIKHPFASHRWKVHDRVCFLRAIGKSSGDSLEGFSLGPIIGSDSLGASGGKCQSLRIPDPKTDLHFDSPPEEKDVGTRAFFRRRTDSSVKDSEILILPFLAIDESESSAIFTLMFPAQSTGFPCISQQVSSFCPDLRQCSHHGRPRYCFWLGCSAIPLDDKPNAPCPFLIVGPKFVSLSGPPLISFPSPKNADPVLFKPPVAGPRLADPLSFKYGSPKYDFKVDLSLLCPKISEFSFIMTYRRDSSRRTSANTSRVEGSGHRPRTLPLTSSSSRFSPARNSNTLVLDLFLYSVTSLDPCLVCHKRVLSSKTCDASSESEYVSFTASHTSLAVGRNRLTVSVGLFVSPQGEDRWVPAYDDDDFCLRFIWSRPSKLSTRSHATIEWIIPENAASGVYRIRHFGAAKHLLGSINHFTGSSSAFVVA
ncbi:neutral ceramidase 1-like [Olea europaea var. sylvestris]|uniref:neutral ceramidase 1-like n=1 Tax=Olea europaea var. sylvestris TaxID=158386 RepID=UPI000C1CDE85|nr:neutral ceramidase 1-like [Olea europaea var. sylvestris]